jgi:hypothetical protein
MSDDPNPSINSELAPVMQSLPNRTSDAALQAAQIRQDLADLLQAAAVDRNLARTKGRQLLRDTRALFHQVRQAVDHREVAGGLVGLTAGEVLGGAVGGVAGAVVAGPVGALVGAEVGAFAVGTLGLKFGTEAVRDFVKDTLPGDAATSPDEGAPDTAANALRRTGSGRYGRTIGFASGGAIGRILAGKRGAVLGELLGEVAGGRTDAAAAQEQQQAAGAAPLVEEDPVNWLDRFGKNTVGEATMMLAAGTIGSVFGPGGRVLGQRLGLIVGTQIAWHKLVEPVDESQLAEAAPDGEQTRPTPESECAANGPTGSPQPETCEPLSELVRRDTGLMLFLAESVHQHAKPALSTILPSMPLPRHLGAGHYIAPKHSWGEQYR